MGAFANMTGDIDSVDALLDRYGVEKAYLDARGEARAASRPTLIGLLGAMGVAAGEDGDAQAALVELERKEWLQPLPASHVMIHGEARRVPITLPSEIHRFDWRLTLESGHVIAGSARFASLPEIATQCIDGRRLERRGFTIEADIPLGYHHFSLDASNVMLLSVAPKHCWMPPAIRDGRRVWGLAAQLYGVRSVSNWGVGDFSDLAFLVQETSRRGGQVIGLNPLHAMFVDDPEQASPYSPASRLLLNVLYIDVVAEVERQGCEQARARISAPDFLERLSDVRAAKFVNYEMVSRLNLEILEVLFEHQSSDEESLEAVAMRDFRETSGETFERHCLYLALRSHFSAQPAVPADWRSWPAEFRNPDSPEVTAWAVKHHKDVTFQVWLQFVADAQLAAAARAAGSMGIGLYRDLAVGPSPSGAETWANQAAMVDGAHIGCPPDIYNPSGQDWGLPPLHPMLLKEQAFRGFIELLRANMRHAGALRIDHVMALQRLYWIPQGSSAAEGAYVRYPFEDLLGIIALESQRNQCLVVGEDLGTVPEGFRERLTEAQMFSYRVLFFEKDQAGFVEPADYPPLSLAVAGSHDLPTLSAWLSGEDLKLKDDLSLVPSPELRTAARSERACDREQLLASFEAQGLKTSLTSSAARFADAAHSFLMRSASAVAMVQLDDVTLETTPVNVPTTSREYPNWRRRRSMTLESLVADPHFKRMTDSICRERTVASGHEGVSQV